MGKKKSGKTRPPQQRRRTKHLHAVPGSDDSRAGDASAPEPPDRGGEHAEASPQGQELFQMLRRALRSDQPLDLLATVSSLVNSTDPRMRDPFESEDASHATLEQLVDSFVGVDYAETTAALHVVAALVADDLLAARLRKVLKGRRQPMPRWLEELDAARVDRVVEMVHVLGDGDDYFLQLRLATGETLTALVYVDHNMGGIVKDAFVIPDTVEAVQAVFAEKIDDPETTFAEVDPAVARAEVEEAVERGAMTYPRPETDSWPQARPVVEWMLRMLPPGGDRRRNHEWTDKELATLRQDFLASPYAAGLDGPDEQGLLEDLTWYGSGYGSGDPLRWSGVRVEILLVDWIPRKIVADVEYLEKAPAVLRGFIAYCHDRVGLRRALTQDVLAAVDRWEPEYRRLIASPRPQGAEAIARAFLEERGQVQGGYEDGFGDEYGDEYGDDLSISEIMMATLDRAVGGRDTLMRLDTDPLPDEPFGWQAVPEDVRGRVHEVLERCDRCADELFDVEHRTAFRRFLARAAANDPAIFRRKSAPDRAAAAVCWAVGRANNTVAHPGALQARELEEWFGVKGPVGQRAEVFLRANGVNPHDQYRGLQLGTPDLLTAARREEITLLRDRYLTWDD